MAIHYPPEFPDAAIAAVEAERLRAEQDFDKGTADTTPFALTANPYMCERTGRLLKEYIFRPFVPFSKEACKLGLEGIWSIEKIQRECEDYLRHSSIEACRDLRGCWDPNLLEWIKREFGKPLFRDYKDLLLRVADAQRPNDSFPVPKQGPVNATAAAESVLPHRVPTRSIPKRRLIEPTPEQMTTANKAVAENAEVAVRVAAQWLRCTISHVHRLAREGHLTASKTRPRRITTDSLRAYKWPQGKPNTPDD